MVLGGQLCSDIPRQELSEAVNRMFCDVPEHVAEIGLGIDAVQRGRVDEA
jgi:hypothetical protein